MYNNKQLTASAISSKGGKHVNNLGVVGRGDKVFSLARNDCSIGYFGSDSYRAAYCDLYYN